MDEEQQVYMENGIIYHISNHAPDLEAAKGVVQRLEELTDHFQMDPVVMLTDVSGGAAGMIGARAMQLFVDTAKKFKHPRVALVARLALARVIINMLIRASGHGNWKIFSDRESALEWLKKPI